MVFMPSLKLLPALSASGLSHLLPSQYPFGQDQIVVGGESRSSSLRSFFRTGFSRGSLPTSDEIIALVLEETILDGGVNPFPGVGAGWRDARRLHVVSDQHVGVHLELDDLASIALHFVSACLLTPSKTSCNDQSNSKVSHHDEVDPTVALRYTMGNP